MPFLTYKLNTICSTPVYHLFSIFHDFDHCAVCHSNMAHYWPITKCCLHQYLLSNSIPPWGIVCGKPAYIKYTMLAHAHTCPCPHLPMPTLTHAVTSHNTPVTLLTNFQIVLGHTVTSIRILRFLELMFCT